MRVLGVDPGLGRTGVALVAGAPGTLRLLHASRLDTVPRSEGAARLASLLALVEAAVREQAPDVAAVERLFFSSNRITAMQVAEARGVILCALARCGVPVCEYTPTQVKDAVCGNGAARKPQVMRMTAQLLGVGETSDDVADACAVAICHHHRARLTMRTAAVARDGGALEAAVARARARLAVLPQ